VSRSAAFVNINRGGSEKAKRLAAAADLDVGFVTAISWARYLRPRIYAGGRACATVSWNICRLTHVGADRER